MKKLCAALPDTIKNIHLVFVVPEDSVGDYPKVQSMPEPHTVKPESKDLFIRQFQLVLQEEKMKSIAVYGLYITGNEEGGDIDECGSGDSDM